MWNVLVGGGIVVWVLVGIGALGAVVFLERVFNLHRAQLVLDLVAAEMGIQVI